MSLKAFFLMSFFWVCVLSIQAFSSGASVEKKSVEKKSFPVCHNPVSECGGECEESKKKNFVYLNPKSVQNTCFVEGSFDFKYSVPKEMKELCHYVKSNTSELKKKINCIRHPGFSKCKKIMAQKKNEFSRDLEQFTKCKRLGYLEYNKLVPEAARRSLSCQYSLQAREHGSKKRVWRDLMPSACGEGKYVADNGVDCCTIDHLENACAGSCQSFYVKRSHALGLLGN